MPTHMQGQSPEELCIRPILSSCPEQICVTCNTPRMPILQSAVTTSEGQPPPGTSSAGRKFDLVTQAGRSAGRRRFPVRFEVARTILGYTDCGCNAGFRPGIVLDPFMGSGTTGVVAQKLGRNFIGIDIKEEYLEIARNRISHVSR